MSNPTSETNAAIISANLVALHARLRCGLLCGHNGTVAHFCITPHKAVQS
jgi:hypothetical protein